MTLTYCVGRWLGWNDLLRAWSHPPWLVPSLLISSPTLAYTCRKCTHKNVLDSLKGGKQIATSFNVSSDSKIAPRLVISLMATLQRGGWYDGAFGEWWCRIVTGSLLNDWIICNHIHERRQAKRYATTSIGAPRAASQMDLIIISNESHVSDVRPRVDCACVFERVPWSQKITTAVGGGGFKCAKTRNKRVNGKLWGRNRTDGANKAGSERNFARNVLRGDQCIRVGNRE